MPLSITLRRLRTGLALLTQLTILTATALAPESAISDEGAEDTPGYIGTDRCAACHQEAFEAWRGSHHDLAMQKPTPDTVLGDFDGARFEHFGSVTEFSTRDGRYFVRTDGPDGELTDYEVAWVFGVYPLQQYLLPLDRGRLQALSVAWDSRPAAEGGQRWYHLYPDEAITSDDPLHWTGPYQNWNTRCAECHSTDVRKNYDAGSRSFDTQFFEDNVGCEGCHGPGSRHESMALAGNLRADPLRGFLVNLGGRGEWAYDEGEAIAARRGALPDQSQIDTCARCHARRSTLGDYRHGQPLSDTHRLALLGDPLYHADGQILDEVYVYGSFVQSKMHMAGVVCSNCHEPHSNKLRAPGNGVCAQCHRSDVFDVPEHHHHATDTAGAQCVSCHMPATTYMGVDDRRDHSMRIPRPDLSVMAGTPNACTDCHDDQSADWALDKLAAWGTRFTDTNRHPALAMAASARGDNRSASRLVSVAADTGQPPIWRATALERGASLGSVDALRLAADLLESPDPLLRVSAVRALGSLPAEQRYGYLAPLASDPVSGVRLAVATQLASTPLDRLSDDDRSALLELFDEYRQVYREHSDMPSINMQVGLFHASRGDLPSAELAYREALSINPQLAAARLNLADLLRAMERDEEAREELTTAVAMNPDDGNAIYALGLLEIREGNREVAIAQLARAAKQPDAAPRHRYVYAIALHDSGDTSGAMRELRRLHRDLPAYEEALLALATYSAESGDREGARRFAGKLVELAPQNPNYQRLARSLGS